MSFRTALRVVSRSRAAPSIRAVTPRRFASSHAKKPSGDMPWMIGSAVIFGGLGAFILMPSETKDHVAHQQHPHEPKEPGEVTFTKQEVEDGVKNKKVEEVAQGNEKESEGVDNYEQVQDAKKEGMDALKSPSSTSSKKEESTLEDASSKKATSSSSPSSSSSEEEESGSDEPTAAEINQSIVQSERIDAPAVAEAAEQE